jgi:rod shape-determining protein MreC
MRNLFLFLYRYNAVFLFLLLQAICIYLVISNNQYQRAWALNVSDEVVGRTMSVYKEVTAYLTLGESNRDLAQENARLHNLAPSLYYGDTSQVIIHRDTVMKQFYSYIPARVLQTTTGETNNYILINKGSNAGIEPRMGVVGPQGVVGIVKDVSPHFATLYSLLHSRVTVSARIRRDGSRGTLRWDGRSPDYSTLEEITRQESLRKGDTIFTSGVSRIFPDNIPIGTVESFKLKEPGNFYEIRVKLATNFRRADYVYVVSNFMHTEMDSLLKLTEDVQ